MGIEIEDFQFYVHVCVCHYLPNNELFIFKSCSLWIFAPILQKIY
jgi:hypothetical protein